MSDEMVTWLDQAALESLIASTADGPEDPVRCREILAKARELKGLTADEVASLMAVRDPELLEEMFHTARTIKDEIYGNRLVLFAPLYISNLCSNECLYCAFRHSNKELVRRCLNMEEIAEETRIIIGMGHKRTLLVAGESYPGDGIDYILRAIDTVYSVHEGHGEIRRLNVNLAPLPVSELKKLKDHNIGTFQVFQETYHRGTYAQMHVAGPKKDFNWRASVMDRAMEAGIDDVGIGPLFGLHDWRFEVLATLLHTQHLEKNYGCGCHTISMPRMEPAVGSDVASQPPAPVSDDDFLKIVALFRLAVPYTGMIMSTREGAEMRRKTLELGISQISAASRTNPGGYAESWREDVAQFQLGDHRSLPEVLADVCELGYLPSFCTGCYRLGRTGHDFMELAKPGLIQQKCTPNALSTFQEYLDDYGNERVRLAGARVIKSELAKLDERTRRVSERLLAKVAEGKRDVFC